MENLLTEPTKLVLDKLDEVVALMGGKIGAFYPYVLRDVYVKGVLYGIGCLLCLAVSVCSFNYLKRMDKPADSDDATQFIAGLVAVAALVLGLVCGVHSFKYLINPHFWAVREIISMIRQ